jgi:hypothetical protein
MVSANPLAFIFFGFGVFSEIRLQACLGGKFEQSLHSVREGTLIR